MAPCSSRYPMVGIEARMRESSLTLPSSMGTLKSTRTRTRLPAGPRPGRSACPWLRAAQAVAAATSMRAADERDEVGHAAAVAPLVVVPGDDLHEVPPSDIVDSASMIEERLSPLKSIDTSGSSETPRMPLSGPAAAVRKASLSSSTVAGRSSSAVKSTTLTVGVGTRRLKPSNLPLRSGMTSASAFAAPVVVGMMFWPAARARRGSLCATSRMRWSFVYEWIVFIRPRLMVQPSWTTLAAGARQLVVQLALLMTWWLGGVVAVLVDAQHDGDVLALGRGADDHLAGAGLEVGARPWSASVNRPVDSITMSTPRSPTGSCAGILHLEHLDRRGRR